MNREVGIDSSLNIIEISEGHLKVILDERLIEENE